MLGLDHLCRSPLQSHAKRLHCWVPSTTAPKIFLQAQNDSAQRRGGTNKHNKSTATMKMFGLKLINEALCHIGLWRVTPFLATSHHARAKLRPVRWMPSSPDPEGSSKPPGSESRVSSPSVWVMGPFSFGHVHHVRSIRLPGPSG